MAFVWSDELKIGVPEIDAQHMMFFDCQKKLVDAASQESNCAAVQEILDFLETYTVEHFRAEEEYMQRHKCSKIQAHIEEHSTFVEKIMEIKQEFKDVGVSKNLIWFIDHFLLHWISTHIMSFDQSLKWCQQASSAD